MPSLPLSLLPPLPPLRSPPSLSPLIGGSTRGKAQASSLPLPFHPQEERVQTTLASKSLPRATLRVRQLHRDGKGSLEQSQHKRRKGTQCRLAGVSPSPRWSFDAGPHTPSLCLCLSRSSKDGDPCPPQTVSQEHDDSHETAKPLQTIFAQRVCEARQAPRSIYPARLHIVTRKAQRQPSQTPACSFDGEQQQQHGWRECECE